MTRNLRAAVEAEIENLIGLLDTIDGDADAEPEEGDCNLAGAETDHEEDLSDDEPYLGWCEGFAQGQGRWGTLDNREVALEPTVTDAERRTYFRRRHANIR